MNAFKRLAVDIYYSAITQQAVLVEWALDETFDEPGPYTFTLQRGRAANDDNFEDIAVTIDQPWAYDNRPIFAQLADITFYRVKLVDGNGRIYISQAVPCETYWERYDWTLAREIVRKENMLLRKRTGAKGWLLKRRVWGEVCPDCVDPVTGMVQTQNCPDCYGTGIEGGYYPAYEYWIGLDPNPRLMKLDADRGLVVEIVETGRGLAYPMLASKDIWVCAHTNKRYVILEDISTVAKHRGIGLVLNLRLKELPQSDPSYGFPTPCQ